MKTGFIDWTEISLNLYVFEKRAGQYNLVDSTSILVENDLEVHTLKSLPVDDCDNIFLSIPLKFLTLREQDFPFSDKAKIKDTIPFELEGILLGDVSDYAIDHIVIESYDISSKVLAACLEKSKLKKLIYMFSSADLEPKVITSLDMRLSGGKSEALMEEPVINIDLRKEAAKEEVAAPSINFRRDELTYMGDITKFVRKLRVSAALLLILLIVLASSSSLRLINLKKGHKLLTNQVQAAYRSVFPEDKKIIDADRQFKGKMNMLVEKRAALASIPVLDTLKNIAVLNSRKITLHEFVTDGKNLILKGTANSFEDVESLKNDFGSSFDNVEVTDSGATADKKIRFTIVMKEKTA